MCSVFCLDRTPNSAHTGPVALDQEVAEGAVLAALAAANVPLASPHDTAELGDRHADLVLDVGGTPVDVQVRQRHMAHRSSYRRTTRPTSWCRTG
jgi:hypothetical protein